MVRRSKRCVGSRRTRRHSRRHSRHSTRSRRIRRVHSRHTRGRRIHDVKIGGVIGARSSSSMGATKTSMASNAILAKAFGFEPSSSSRDSSRGKGVVERRDLSERNYDPRANYI